MSTNFPTSIDSLTNPTATDSVATIDHAAQHANANDAIEALEAKVGANSSAVTTSHDYKLSEVTTTDKAVGKVATQTLTNKTLTSPTLTTPVIADYSSATHTHEASATGGQLNASNVFSAGTVPLARGGTGASLADPNADRILFWDDSESTTAFLTVGTGLQISGTTLSSAANTPTIVVYESDAVGKGSTALSNISANTNTTMTVGLVNIPAQITVNKISIEVQTVGVEGTLDLLVYSEDGQTKHIDVTTASISGTGASTTAVSSVILSAGNYYFAIIPNGTADITVRALSISATALRNISGEPFTAGTLAVSAGTPPTTFTPSGLTVGQVVPLFRLDN